MAELHVEPKKHNSSTWLWILVSLAIVAIIAYFLLRDNKMVETSKANPNATSYIHASPGEGFDNTQVTYQI